MAEKGGGDPRVTNADLAALPPELAKQSISQGMVMLPRDAALAAIAYLSEHGRLIENWEGWMRLSDGSRTKSLNHPGSFALSRDPQRAAQAAVAAMQKAQAEWDRRPEYHGATLYFGLSFSVA